MRRKQIYVTLAVFSLISGVAPSVAAQSADVTLDHVTGLYPGTQDSLDCTLGEVEFYLRIENSLGEPITGLTNGFRLWSPDGASVDISLSHWNSSINWQTDYWDGGIFVNLFGDTVGFGAFRLFKPGYPSPASDVAFVISTSISCTDRGRLLCLDSAFYRPTGYWYWSTPSQNVAPGWSGMKCWDIAELPCKGCIPEFTNCPGPMISDHCVPVSYDFDATVVPEAPISYAMLTGPGSINSESGLWQYTPTAADVGATIEVGVEACSYTGCGSPCTLMLTLLNEAEPQFVAGFNAYVPMSGSVTTHQLTAESGDCDDLSYSYEYSQPATGGISIDSATGLISCLADSLAPDTVYDAVFAVSDGVASDTCYVWFIKATCITPGNINHLGDVDISDLTYMVGYLFDGGYPPPSLGEGDVDGSGFIDITDLTYFVEWFFGGGPAPVPCP